MFHSSVSLFGNFPRPSPIGIENSVNYTTLTSICKLTDINVVPHSLVHGLIYVLIYRSRIRQ